MKRIALVAALTVFLVVSVAGAAYAMGFGGGKDGEICPSITDLTDAQRGEMEALYDEYRGLQEELREKSRELARQGEREELEALRAEFFGLREQLRVEMEGILTEEQLESLGSNCGDPVLQRKAEARMLRTRSGCGGGMGNMRWGR